MQIPSAGTPWSIRSVIYTCSYSTSTTNKCFSGIYLTLDPKLCNIFFESTSEQLIWNWVISLPFTINKFIEEGSLTNHYITKKPGIL
jgi:hypothetical protein